MTRFEASESGLGGRRALGCHVTDVLLVLFFYCFALGLGVAPVLLRAANSNGRRCQCTVMILPLVIVAETPTTRPFATFGLVKC